MCRSDTYKATLVGLSEADAASDSNANCLHLMGRAECNEDLCRMDVHR